MKEKGTTEIYNCAKYQICINDRGPFKPLMAEIVKVLCMLIQLIYIYHILRYERS